MIIIVDKPTSESPLSFRGIFNKSSTKKSSHLSTVNLLKLICDKLYIYLTPFIFKLQTKKSKVTAKKQKNGVVSMQMSTSQDTIPQNLPLPYIQLSDVEVNSTNTKKQVFFC